MSKVFIACHQGLGDHILCNGIYREYASINDRCVIGVKKKYAETIRYMLSDVKNIKIVLLPESKSWRYIRLWRIFYKSIGYKILGLGSQGLNFFPPGVRFDQNFYDQAKLDFNKRWTSFHFPRNKAKEKILFEELQCETGKYIFLHEDNSRNFTINRNLIKTNLKIVSPINNITKSNFFDYAFVIENAAEIHCIESSFAALVESLQLDIKKFSHRYARHHALNDFRHEFTYKSSWTIIT